MIDDLVMYRVGQTEKKLKKNERKHCGNFENVMNVLYSSL